MVNVKQEHQAVELTLARRFVAHGGIPTIDNQMMHLDRMYVDDETALFVAQQGPQTYYSQQVSESCVIRMIYIQRLISKLRKIERSR